MRSLPSLATATAFQPRITLSLLAADASTTFVHCNDSIANMSAVSWAGPFQGGLGLPSMYSVDVAFQDAATAAARMAKYLRATATLRVDIGSDFFIPHVGRVKATQRRGDAPNIAQLTIFDRFVDDNPMIPRDALVDSYTAVHPADADKGYPLYYGHEGKRPFYFVATDCDINVLLGPRNVTSASHITSLWVNADVITRNAASPGRQSARTEVTYNVWRFNIPGPTTIGPIQGLLPLGDAVETLKHNLLLNKVWAQQSGGTNAASGGYPFEVKDVSTSDTRIFKWNGLLSVPVSVPTSQGALSFYRDSIIAGDATVYSGGSGLNFEPAVSKAFSLPIHNVTRVTIVASFTSALSANISDASLYAVSDTSSGPFLSLIAASSRSRVIDADVDIASGGNTFLQENTTNARIQFNAYANPFAQSPLVASIMMRLRAQLRSDAYRAYSIWGQNSNHTSENPTAISTVPTTILDHVNSMEINMPWRQDQSSSVSAAIVAGHNTRFHCIFMQRKPAAAIFDEFGALAQFTMWVGDSGMMNFRAYAESATATVDRTLTTCDYLSGAFALQENPIGTDKTTIVGDITVNYGWSFHMQQYERTLRAYRGNNALCNSVWQSGNRQSVTFGTEYIPTPYSGDVDVASAWLASIVRQYAQGNRVVTARVPLRHADIELYDVLRMEHPIIPNSASTFQVIGLEANYMEGWIGLAAQELLSLTPT